MKLLITGASGLLGLNLALDAARHHTVVGIDRGTLVSPPFELMVVDLLEPGSMERALEASGAEAVIHCAAIADVDVCEGNPKLAWTLNAELAGRVADACQKARVRLAHVSTDAVFDGTSARPYVETDPPHPIGVYAETKRAGEIRVLDAYPDAIVARVNFYGWSATGRRSLAEFFVSNLSAGRPVRGFADVTFCPMLVNHLAGVFLQMLDANLHGLYHAVGPEPMTKYEFGVRIARRFGFDEGFIKADSVERAGLSAPRAHNLNLSVEKLSTALGQALPSFSTGLELYYAQYAQGYPHQVRSLHQGLAAQTQAGEVSPGPKGRE